MRHSPIPVSVVNKVVGGLVLDRRGRWAPIAEAAAEFEAMLEAVDGLAPPQTARRGSTRGDTSSAPRADYQAAEEGLERDTVAIDLGDLAVSEQAGSEGTVTLARGPKADAAPTQEYNELANDTALFEVNIADASALAEDGGAAAEPESASRILGRRMVFAALIVVSALVLIAAGFLLVRLLS